MNLPCDNTQFHPDGPAEAKVSFVFLGNTSVDTVTFLCAVCATEAIDVWLDDADPDAAYEIRLLP